MAEKRMFSKQIIDSDAFLDMPLSTQALYFHLSMRADDDGFINNPKKIQRVVGASEDDLKLLIAKNFIIPFESGIVVIKHWRIHNYIQKDRYKPTVYTEEMKLLTLKGNNVYTMDTGRIQDVSELEAQNSIDKIKLDEISNNMSGKPDRADDRKAIISYLNQKTGKEFRANTKATTKLIEARLNDGYSVDDFKKVIDNKCAEWLGTEQEQYLRPETLFAPSHFESYLNQKPISKPISKPKSNQVSDNMKHHYSEEEWLELRRRAKE